MYKRQLKEIEKSRRKELKGNKVIVPLEDCEFECLVYPSSSKGKTAVYFDIHGGGFAFGTVYDQDGVCSYINKRTGILVVSCSYRLAPAHPYPMPLNDVYAIIKYFINNNAYNIDKNRIFIGGYSAGGNLAVEVCIRAKEQDDFTPHRQILIYPYLDVDNTGESRPKIKMSLPNSAYKFFKECYCTKEYNSKDPYISPIYANAEMLKGLPEAYVLTCGRDNLNIDGRKYAELLEINGVKVTLKHYKDAIHGFIENASKKYCMNEEFKDEDDIQIRLANEAVDDIINWMTIKE